MKYYKLLDNVELYDKINLIKFLEYVSADLEESPADAKAESLEKFISAM